MPALPAAEIDRVFREEHGRAVAVLVRTFGDIDIAEEAVQDAFTAAVQRWPSSGLPPSPAGWIITTARNRAIDRLRREASRGDRHAEAAQQIYTRDQPIEEDAVRDDRLRLIFTCCHPAIATVAQVALTLRLLGGLTTAEIARAFLVSEPRSPPPRSKDPRPRSPSSTVSISIAITCSMPSAPTCSGVWAVTRRPSWRTRRRSRAPATPPSVPSSNAADRRLPEPVTASMARR